MPFPAMLLWTAAAAVGLKKGYDAQRDMSKAVSIGKAAESCLRMAREGLEESRLGTQKALEALGQARLDALTWQIRLLADRVSGTKDESCMADALALVRKALEAEKALGSGASPRVLASLGAFGCARTLGAASPGEVLEGMNCAAGQNPTLAWLSGALATGAGVAGGTLFLGGMALGPLLAVGGFWLAGKARNALTRAQDYLEEATRIVQQMEAAGKAMQAIRKAAEDTGAAQREAVRRLDEALWTGAEPGTLLRRGKVLLKILDVPVIAEDGSADASAAGQCADLLSAI